MGDLIRPAYGYCSLCDERAESPVTYTYTWAGIELEVLFCEKHRQIVETAALADLKEALEEEGLEAPQTIAPPPTLP